MDRYTLKTSPDLDACLTGPGAPIRRAQLADEAWRAFQAAGGTASGHTLDDFQQDAIEAEIERCTASAARNQVGREQIAQATFGPDGGRIGELDRDNPASLAAHGMHFTARQVAREQAETDHNARRRRIDAAVASDERLYQNLRRTEGTDFADNYMTGGDAA